MENDFRIFGFPPVWRRDARILILGSMPSVESLKQEFYYAHPRNAFWRIIADIADAKIPQTTDEKKELLISNQIALWDTIGSCVRQGSLDSNIRSAVPNDFETLFTDCPHIRTVFFNGGTAQAMYKKEVGYVSGLSYRKLPSTSPAYTMPYAEKLAIWKRAFREVMQNETV